MAVAYFADSFYWIALVHRQDLWHGRVVAWADAHPGARLVTTEEVLTEVLNWFSGRGSVGRVTAAIAARKIVGHPSVQVLPQSSADFDAALALYEARPDKSYSLVDCRSMNAMRALGISEVLTNDHHFEQEGAYDRV
jgi:predicted nucleic acid-binding protein